MSTRFKYRRSYELFDSGIQLKGNFAASNPLEIDVMLLNLAIGRVSNLDEVCRSK